MVYFLIFSKEPEIITVLQTLMFQVRTEAEASPEAVTSSVVEGPRVNANSLHWSTASTYTVTNISNVSLKNITAEK